jgi:acylaminoacyl-peptidase
VTHGQLDYRVSVSQGISTFTALQRRGIESRLVVFPDENHWVLKPRNARRFHEEVFGWIDRHLAAPGAGTPRP